MNDRSSPEKFRPLPPDTANVVSWVHLGDLHITRAGEQNYKDLADIVDEINSAFAGAVSFVYLPGDVADDGSRPAYTVVRRELDRLSIPWCAIVGDHDVHERSFTNFLDAMSPRTHYAFTIGDVRFIAMNAFDIPDPPSFTVKTNQLAWVRRELQNATAAAQTKVLLLHCYPSDLKVGREPLQEIVKSLDVRLIDMGHTHYNEVANDGHTLYTATRSTGQIEEGPVGFSVTNIDRGVVSWRFFKRGHLPAVMITSPADERLNTALEGSPRIASLRAKAWSDARITSVTALFEGNEFPLHRVHESQVWEAGFDDQDLEDGIYRLCVRAVDATGRSAEDEIRIIVGDPAAIPERAPLDQQNALDPWPEHGLLGTQLGPNKNGKKW